MTATDEAYQKFPTIVPDDEQDFLKQIMDWQLELQTALYGVHPADLPHDERIRYIKDMFIAAGAELQEMLDEVSWKPWASSRFINREAGQGEVIDVLHFVFSLALAFGMTPGMVFEKYAEKQERNRERQRVGYDGIRDKCIICKRDVRDVQISTGLAPLTASNVGDYYCGKCGRGQS